MFQSLCEIVEYFLHIINDTFPQKWSCLHGWCPIFQILSIFCLTLHSTNFVLKSWNCIMSNGSFEVSSHFPWWIFWHSLWISWCDVKDTFLEYQNTINQCNLHCIFQHLLFDLHFCHYTTISHKTSKWSSFPSNHGVEITNCTSYHTPILSCILSPTVIVGQKSILNLWVVLIYSTWFLIYLLNCIDHWSALKSNKHLIPLWLAVGRVEVISPISFIISTFGYMPILLLKSLAKLLNRLFAILYYHR